MKKICPGRRGKKECLVPVLSPPLLTDALTRGCSEMQWQASAADKMYHVEASCSSSRLRLQGHIQFVDGMWFLQNSSRTLTFILILRMEMIGGGQFFLSLGRAWTERDWRFHLYGKTLDRSLFFLWFIVISNPVKFPTLPTPLVSSYFPESYVSVKPGFLSHRLLSPKHSHQTSLWRMFEGPVHTGPLSVHCPTAGHSFPSSSDASGVQLKPLLLWEAWSYLLPHPPLCFLSILWYLRVSCLFTGLPLLTLWGDGGSHVRIFIPC